MKVNSAPEDSELTTSIVNITASFTPCTLARSAGVWDSVSSVVAPTNRKFHPIPTSTSANQKCATSTPDSAIATHPTLRTTPVSSMVIRPKRWISFPVTNDGANMLMKCHWMTKAASLNGCWHATMASGVAVMIRFITP